MSEPAADGPDSAAPRDLDAPVDVDEPVRRHRPRSRPGPGVRADGSRRPSGSGADRRGETGGEPGSSTNRPAAGVRGAAATAVAVEGARDDGDSPVGRRARVGGHGRRSGRSRPRHPLTGSTPSPSRRGPQPRRAARALDRGAAPNGRGGREGAGAPAPHRRLAARARARRGRAGRTDAASRRTSRRRPDQDPGQAPPGRSRPGWRRGPAGRAPGRGRGATSTAAVGSRRRSGKGGRGPATGGGHRGRAL